MLKVRFGLIGALVLLVLVGCANRSQAPARISGRVTYKGQPVKAGNITFHTAENTPFPSSLGTDGSYEIVDMATGPMTVTVETESMNPEKKAQSYPTRGNPAGSKAAAMDAMRIAAEKESGGGGPMSKEEMAARYVKIPEKYSSPKTSGLTVNISNGRQSKDFELTD
jgi:hypothetical protein